MCSETARPDSTKVGRALTRSKQMIKLRTIKVDVTMSFYKKVQEENRAQKLECKIDIEIPLQSYTSSSVDYLSIYSAGRVLQQWE